MCMLQQCTEQNRALNLLSYSYTTQLVKQRVIIYGIRRLCSRRSIQYGVYAQMQAMPAIRSGSVCEWS
jgi:hypothetical protein